MSVVGSPVVGSADPGQRLTWLILLTIALMLSGCVRSARDSAPAAPDDLIVYEASDGSVTNIYTIDALSGEGRQLTNGDTFHGNPAWSPDRTKIVFSSQRDGQTQNDLYVMDSRGRNVRRLTDTPNAGEFSPKYSPDGRTLAYTRQDEDTWTVWEIGADGSDLRQLAGPYAFAEFPAWTHDGRELYYSAIEETGAGAGAEYDAGSYLATSAASADIFSVDVQTLEVKTRIRTAGTDACPHLSRDDTRLIYASTGTANSANLAIFSHDTQSDDTTGAADTPLTDARAERLREPIARWSQHHLRVGSRWQHRAVHHER